MCSSPNNVHLEDALPGVLYRPSALVLKANKTFLSDDVHTILLVIKFMFAF